MEFNIKNLIVDLISTDKKRSNKYKINVIYSIILQAIGVALSLVIVPITIDFLGVEEFGIWITLSNLITWLTFLDFGLGHGLRNLYAQSKANLDLDKMKKLVSTSFFLLLSISAFIFIVFLFLYRRINWVKLLNAPERLSSEIQFLILILVCTFCIRFVFGLVNSILLAEQDAFIPLLSIVLGN